MSTTDHAFLREPPQAPSRPAYERVSRPRRAANTFEITERTRIGGIIRAARVRKGIPQCEAAAQLQVWASDLSAWELGREAIPMHRRSALAELYGLDPALLHGIDVAEIAVTPRERSILAAIRSLSEADQDAFLALVAP